MDFEPELGQAIWGQPQHCIAVPKWLATFLGCIRKLLSVTKQIDPFGNNADYFENEVFFVESYSWDEDIEQCYNFKWHDVEISWYKYLGRGMSMNREMSVKEGVKMLIECLLSIGEAK